VPGEISLNKLKEEDSCTGIIGRYQRPGREARNRRGTPVTGGEPSKELLADMGKGGRMARKGALTEVKG